MSVYSDASGDTAGENPPPLASQYQLKPIYLNIMLLNKNEVVKSKVTAKTGTGLFARAAGKALASTANRLVSSVMVMGAITEKVGAGGGGGGGCVFNPPLSMLCMLIQSPIYIWVCVYGVYLTRTPSLCAVYVYFTSSLYAADMYLTPSLYVLITYHYVYEQVITNVEAAVALMGIKATLEKVFQQDAFVVVRVQVPIW
jgi:hypothetical protein